MTDSYNVQRLDNPFSQNNMPSLRQGANTNMSVMGTSEVQKNIAEVQASLQIAKMFPRDPVKACDNILNACTRPTLASVAVYQYARGGTSISGPSIRLMEIIKAQWGNIQSGWRELSNDGNVAVLQAYAWDVETNAREERTFSVPLERYTKKGSYKLTDPRDIYELEANNAARRVRACLQAILPGDIIEQAVRQCNITMQAQVDTSPESIKKLLGAFAEFHVTKEMIEERIQRRIETILPAQFLQLRQIYVSLNDGVGKVEDYFTVAPSAPQSQQVAQSESDAFASAIGMPTAQETAPAKSSKKTKKAEANPLFEKTMNLIQTMTADFDAEGLKTMINNDGSLSVEEKSALHEALNKKVDELTSEL